MAWVVKGEKIFINSNMTREKIKRKFKSHTFVDTVYDTVFDTVQR